jgi:hypothetical protein
VNDPDKAIRTAYKNALDGNLTFNSLPVPVVDEKLHADDRNDVYVMFSTQNANDKPNKTYHATEVNLAVLVVNRRESTVQKSVIDNISDQILQIVLPTLNTHGLTIGSPFKITFVKRDNSNTEGAKLEDGTFIIAKQINFRNRITQQ